MMGKVTKRHEEARQLIIDGLRSIDDLTAEDLLAVASQVVGSLIALQDQRKHEPEQVILMVHRNIELGNQGTIGLIYDTKGSA